MASTSIRAMRNLEAAIVVVVVVGDNARKVE